MIGPGDEPFCAPGASNQLLFPCFDDPVGWDSTTNDPFVQTLMGTLPSGSQLGLSLAVYPDLSANYDMDGGMGTQDAHEESAGGDLGLTLPSGRQPESKNVVLLGNGSRHGSNDKLLGEENDSPRGSSKSQQTLVGLPHGRVGEPGREAPRPELRLESLGLKARNSNMLRSPRPVRKRLLPKRLADSNMATRLPTATALRYAGATGAKQQADHIPACHSQIQLQVISGDQVSSGPDSTLGNSAQSQNNPGAVPNSKRKQVARSEIVECSKQHSSVMAVTTRNESRTRPSFADLVRCGVMRPGAHTFFVGQAPVVAEVCEDGTIQYQDTRFRAVSKFALTVLRARNPARQSCDGWKEMSWNGEKLDKLRARVAAWPLPGSRP